MSKQKWLHYIVFPIMEGALPIRWWSPSDAGNREQRIGKKNNISVFLPNIKIIPKISVNFPSCERES